jgi:hypothetical protein
MSGFYELISFCCDVLVVVGVVVVGDDREAGRFLCE